MKYQPVCDPKPRQGNPNYVPIVYTNPINCSQHTTTFGDVIQLGHYYRCYDGIWICVVCRRAAPKP